MRAEKWLNTFVRFIALLERMGNALGTLAFIWGTVVVLGGFSAYLVDDFWVATVIVFVEGFRAFSRQSSSDHRLLFKTTGGIKLKRVELNSGSLYYINAVIMVGCLWELGDLYIFDRIMADPDPLGGYSSMFTALALLLIIHKLGLYTLIGYISKKKSHILLQLCPPISLLITGFSLCYSGSYCDFDWADCSLIPLWFGIYILAMFGSPVANCPFDEKVKLAARLLRVILLVVASYGLWTWFQVFGIIFCLGPLVCGNLQTPIAMAQIELSWTWLLEYNTEVHGPKNKNVKPAVKILYIMVMCQGVLYFSACILESFSLLLRRSLALCCGLVDKLGMESIDLYYEQAYDTFLQESLFDTTKKVCLLKFVVDCLDPDSSRDRKRAAVRILDSFLQKHKFSSSNNATLVPLITNSTKAVTTLISMLGWRAKEDADIRLFATKVIAHLAPYVQIVGIPGTMQKVSSLLDAQDQLMAQDISGHIVIGNGSSNSALDIEGGNAAPVRGCSLIYKFFLLLLVGIRRFWQHLKKLQSLPHKDSKVMDSLPALGMEIIEGFGHDLHNCEEMNRTELLPKIIRLIRCIPGAITRQQKEITTSSLKLIEKLASVEGNIGITLRQELYENPYLIGNLTEILELEGSSRYLEQSKLAINIIAKIAMDKEARKKIGTVQVIIDKLVQEFIGEDESSKPLQAEAGEALAKLAIGSPGNCAAMLDKSSYELIGGLTGKLQCGRHVYPAASLLQSLCKNSRQLVFSHEGTNDRLSSTLTVVLAGVKNAEGKQMEALIGLASQICSVMPGGIAPVLDSFADDHAFVDKLVAEVNAHKIPSPDECPHMRRMLVELTVSIVDSCPRYALIFSEHGMMEALSKVEHYMCLLFSEEAEDLPAMVARAKGLIGTDMT